MGNPWIRRIIKVAGVIVVIAALTVPWIFPAAMTAVVMKIAEVIPPLTLPLVVLLVVEATLALFTAIWWLWWRLPKRQVHGLDIQIHDPKARADTEDNFRKTVGQALGGAAVLIGAVAAYLQFTQQQQASHDLLISNQVAKGFEQLASDKVTMRLGGLYALEGVMNTSKQYHQPVLEALCAFVRGGTIGMIDGERPSTDIQAALTVIGRREAEEKDRVDLSAARIAGANLAGANLTGANLRGAHLSLDNLHGANLTGANLIGADLDGTDLSGANLSGAHLSLAGLFDALVPSKGATEGEATTLGRHSSTRPAASGPRICRMASNGMRSAHADKVGRPVIRSTTITKMANGTGTADLTKAFAAMGDDPYDFVAIPYTDGATLDAVQDLMNDVTGRPLPGMNAPSAAVCGVTAPAVVAASTPLATAAAAWPAISPDTLPRLRVVGHAPEPAPELDDGRQLAALLVQQPLGPARAA